MSTMIDQSPSSSRHGEKDTEIVESARAEGEHVEQAPHLHAKTYLAVFTVCLIYYAQLVNLVGAGAVSILELNGWSHC